ncbi:Autophagy protein 7 [Tulasnella sp. 331]|nr:Autophagy protein 7 [Tulasnella sp. 331]
MAPAANPIASSVMQFTPFSSVVQPAFWHELTKLKIDVLKLSQEAVTIYGTYSIGRSVTDRETGKEVTLGCNLSLGGDAFSKEADVKPPPHSVIVRGSLKNFNTIEDFKNANKQEIFNEAAKQMWATMDETGDASHLSQFLLITFADLKKYKYYYWFAFPAFISNPPWEKVGEWQPATEVIPVKGLENIHASMHSASILSTTASKLPQAIASSMLAKPSANDTNIYETAPLEKFSEFFEGTPTSQRIVIFSDPSAHVQYAGWPLRNILTYIQQRHTDVAALSETKPLNIVAWRDVEVADPGAKWRSLVIKTYVSAQPKDGLAQTVPGALGWERNAAGKLGPRMADLAPMMDPTKLADQAVDLNLKLMRWRVLPGLDLEKVSGTKCLLLGAGTLGCYVARTLMAWGVRKITFLDSARVSFSNPVRQPLFEFEDCLDGGKPKAATAAARLRKIFPGIDAEGHELAIPMPGHPIPSQSVEQTKRDVAKLIKLVDDHDAMFLLMDSRESRWLPTVLGAVKGKIVINCALGFDTYLVMRHGARETIAAGSGTARLGCYYCNDIVAPADSLKDQTLDQMCTVTRPGLAAIASATAVELLVSVLQHPKGINAPSPPPATSNASNQQRAPENDDSHTVLGIVPHQLRGYLARFNNMLITGGAFGNCTGCSEPILNAYEKDGFPMLLKVFNELGYLEKISGLDKLHDAGDAAMESVDWDEDED